MATTPVLFAFHCQLAKDKLKFTHNIPSSLIGPNASANPNYIPLFTKTLEPIMHEHESACLAASSPQCESCGSKAIRSLKTPMSWLHIAESPFVNVWVNPVCAKDECEGKTRLHIQDMMALMDSEATKEGIGGETKEVLACKVCGETQGTLKCAGCKAVSYCGRECQKGDWKAHKVLCKVLARG